MRKIILFDVDGTLLDIHKSRKSYLKYWLDPSKLLNNLLVFFSIVFDLSLPKKLINNSYLEKDVFSKEIAKKIADDKFIYGCYERSGLPVKRFLYSSERPFAWSSGMLLWALKFRS